MILHPIEIDGFQVDATDIAIIHGTVINLLVSGVRCYGELGSTRHIVVGGDVKVIQYMESLCHTSIGIGLLESHRLEESGTDESGRRSEIARKSQHTASMSKRFQFDGT